MPWKPKTRTCQLCGEDYLGTPRNKYCSYECSHKSRESKRICNCKNCGIEIVSQNYRIRVFCSYECRNEFKRSKILDLTCLNCNKEFKRKSHLVGEKTFCSRECTINFLKGENHYNWKEDIHDYEITLKLRRWSRSIKKRDNYICQNCGEQNKRKLQSHHIKPKSKFPENQFDIDNGITLCIDCHIKEHIEDSNLCKLISSHKKKLEYA